MLADEERQNLFDEFKDVLLLTQNSLLIPNIESVKNVTQDQNSANEQGPPGHHGSVVERQLDLLPEPAAPLNSRLNQGQLGAIFFGSLKNANSQL